jgi:beta-RFAP synthase
VAAALSRLHGLPGDVPAWCAALGRARRSGIGAHAFRLGGFLLDAGRTDGSQAPPPLVFRQPFPEEWGLLAVVPAAGRGVSGREEERAFEDLQRPPEALLERLCGLILMRLIPALLERDLRAFGAALESVQEGVGRCFEEVQGGLYHPQALPIVRWLRNAGGVGVGQSSWGPTVYAFTPTAAAARALAGGFRERGPCAPGTELLLMQPRNRSAEVTVAAV